MVSPDTQAGRPEKCPKCGAVTLVPHPRAGGATASSFKPMVDASKPRTNRSHAFGVASVIIGSVACLTLWFPIPYLPTTLLCVIGLLSAGIAYFASRRRWKRHLTTPFIGSILCGVAMYFAIFGGHTETVDPPDSLPDNIAAPTPTAPPVAPPVAPPITPPVAPPITPPVAQPKLAIGMAHQWDDRTLKLVAMKVDNVTLKSVTGDSRSQDKFLMITIEASNTSATPGRNITYTTLRGETSATARTYASLSDSTGKFYNRVDFGPNTYPTGSVAKSVTIPPGRAIGDILLFERPDQSAGPYRLDLPLGNLGGVGVATWEIPAEAIR